MARLTRTAFAKFGFSAAGLVTDWAAIAGTELAAYTRPERLKWPQAAAPDGDGAKATGRRGATLVLRVEGGRGLDVQFGARQIIQRINAYFGYAAVAELRIVQGPVAASTAGHQESREESRREAGQAGALPWPAAQDLAGIGDAALRQALLRLGAGVRHGARS